MTSCAKRIRYFGEPTQSTFKNQLLIGAAGVAGSSGVPVEKLPWPSKRFFNASYTDLAPGIPPVAAAAESLYPVSAVA